MLGIVIHSEKIKESDVRIKLLCADGLKNFTLVGAQKPTAKLKVAGQLFCLAEYQSIGHKIAGAHVLETHHGIVKDIKRYYLACAICEVVSRLQVFTQQIFNLTLAAFKALSDGASPREIYTEYFVALLRELGFDIEKGQDINTAFVACLDIKIPHTREFLS